MIVALQNNIDVLGNQEINPGFDTGFRAMLGSAGEVRLVPVRDCAPVRVGVEVLLQPGCDVAYTASAGPGTGVGKSNEVPAPFIKGVRGVRPEGDPALVAMSAAAVEVLQRIGVLPELVMVWCQDGIHLRNVRAPILIEIAVVFRHRAVIVLKVAQSENEIGFGRFSRSGGGDR